MKILFKNIIKVLILLGVFSNVAFSLDSPDELYNITLVKEYDIWTLKVNKKQKTVLNIGSGYGKFLEYQWSADSKYLAIVERGTKTSTSLYIYKMNGDKEPRLINLPNFEMNILGRHGLIERGRHNFVNQIKWLNESHLTFIAIGSMVNWGSNSADFPQHWYKYQVTLKLEEFSASLMSITHLNNEIPRGKEEQLASAKVDTQKKAEERAVEWLATNYGVLEKESLEFTGLHQSSRRYSQSEDTYFWEFRVREHFVKFSGIIIVDANTAGVEGIIISEIDE